MLILFRALLDEISTFTGRFFVGICVVFVFTGWGCAAVGSAAQDVVEEVRRQFKDHPGIMNYTEEPDYEKCVTIVTKAALREMFRPACLCLGSPVLIGFIFKWIGGLTGQPDLSAEVLASFLMFCTLTALLMAIFMDNAGGAWDNAKK